MKYFAPYGSSDPNAPYVNGNPQTGTPGSIPPAGALEQPQREIVAAIAAAGLTPDENALNQLAYAIQKGMNYVVATGTANAWTVGPSLAPLAYAAGLPFDIIAPATNTSTSVTANVSALGTKSIKRSDGADPQIGDLVAGTLYRTVYDGTNIRISGQLPSQARAASFKVNRVIFATPGSFSWTVPSGVTRANLIGWGGGGGGGFGASGSPGGGASGGGAGGYFEHTIDVSPGDTISGVIGAAGAAGFAGNNGGAGGDTTITAAGITYTAQKGIGGQNANAGSVGNSQSGGVPSASSGSLDISRTGEPSAGGFQAASAYGGKGGSSPNGGLGGQAGSGNANNGAAPGGGGGGGANGFAAGTGARGEVWIQY